MNLILTLRKAVSLAISVWYYGNGASNGLVFGGAMVLTGTMIYSIASPPRVVGDGKRNDNARERKQNGEIDDESKGMEAVDKQELESETVIETRASSSSVKTNGLAGLRQR